MTWRIETGDCLALLKTLESGSVDAVVTDIPYGVQYAKWDADMPPQLFLDECLRVSTGVVMMFGAASRVLDFGRYTPAPTRMFVWAPAFTLACSAAHGAFYRWHPVAAWRPEEADGKLESDVLRNNTDGGHWWDHPATKPVSLMVDLVRWTSTGGGTILDPFCGSGTTGVACILTGRNFIGMEIDENYAAIARRRCREAEESQGLFVPPQPRIDDPELFKEQAQ